MTSTALAAVESTRLAELEHVIERGLATFVEVGQALLEIRDSRLYRDTHGAFEDYCRDRWQMSRPRAYQLIQGAEVAGVLSTTVDTPILNERQARELAPLLNEPEQLQETWAEVVDLHPAPTAADVREVVRDRMGVHYSSATDEWATPPDLFWDLNCEFRFSLDVCALPENAKCERYFTPADNGLIQQWEGHCWMNPPYGDAISAWVKKAHESADAGHAVVVCLLPARVDTGWWWDHCRFGEIRFLRGRLKFGGGENSAPFPSAVVIFGRPARVVWWER